jgi:hypothetical protein
VACQMLLRRKAQLALLVRACEGSVPARLALRRNAGTTGEVDLVALERDGLLVAWRGAPLPAAEVPGQRVEVCFEYEGEPYVLFAATRGRVEEGREGKEAWGLLKLSLPLRLERARRRQHVRLALEGLPPLMATFTHVVDDRRQFQAQLTDIADGGMGVIARSADVPPLSSGDLFWVEAELPGRKAPSEFVVRLVHLRPIRNSDTLAMGWAFQPADDVANYERYLRRLEALVTLKVERRGVGRTG